MAYDRLKPTYIVFLSDNVTNKVHHFSFKKTDIFQLLHVSASSAILRDPLWVLMDGNEVCTVCYD